MSYLISSIWIIQGGICFVSSRIKRRKIIFFVCTYSVKSTTPGRLIVGLYLGLVGNAPKQYLSSKWWIGSNLFGRDLPCWFIILCIHNLKKTFACCIWSILLDSSSWALQASSKMFYFYFWCFLYVFSMSTFYRKWAPWIKYCLNILSDYYWEEVVGYHVAFWNGRSVCNLPE